MFQARIGVGVAALATAAVLLGLAVASSGAHAQNQGVIPGATYTGSIEDTSGLCSQGALTLGEEFRLTVSEYGGSIVSLDVTGLTYEGISPTLFVSSLPANVPVADDGSFDHDFDVYGLASVHIEGLFEGETLSGSFGVRVDGSVECEGNFSAHGSPPELVEKTFEGWTRAVGEDCGGGTISVTRSADRMSVIAVSVEELGAGGTTTSGSATFAEGTVPISAPEGSFAYAYFPGSESSQEISVSGTFSGAMLTGAVWVSPSSCGPAPFLALVGAFGTGDRGLPDTGGGMGAGSGDALAPWAMVAIAAGLLSLGAGLASRRSRR